MGWLILGGLCGVLAFFMFRAWKVWQTRFANRHEFDPDYVAVLMAQREEIDGPIEQMGQGPARKSRSSNPSPAPRAPHPADPASPVSPEGTTRRKPVLDPVAQGVYLQLRTEMTSHPMLSAVDLAALLPGSAAQAPRFQVDFVICKKDFTPVVAIFIERDEHRPMIDRAEALLRQNRLRVLRWHPSDLPSRDEMRAQIFKQKTSAGAA